MNAAKVKAPPSKGLLGDDDEPTINELLAKDPRAVFPDMEAERRKDLIARFGGHTLGQLNKVIAAESFSPKLDKVHTSPNLVQGVTSGKAGSIMDVTQALEESARSRDALRAALFGANTAGVPSSVIKKDAPQEHKVEEGGAKGEEVPRPAPAPVLAAPQPSPAPTAPEPAPAPAEPADPLKDLRSLYEEVRKSNAAIGGSERKLNRSVNLDPAMVDLIPMLCDLWTDQAGFKISMANLMRRYIKEGLERDSEHFLNGGKK